MTWGGGEGREAYKNKYYPKISTYFVIFFK